MPGRGVRYRQSGFWTFRYGHCEKCGSVEKYEVRAKRGERLRAQRCHKCSAILGRNANTRAKGHVRAAKAVEQLARKMRFPIVTP